jgi:hypothetical protein
LACAAADLTHFKTATVLTLKSLAMLPIETPQYPYRTMAKNFSAGLTPLTFVAVN